MIATSLPSPSLRFARRPGREGGVVLFVALIVMVALSLAAVALVRSVDTTNTVIGNLAFRQASILPANMAVEAAAAALFPNADPLGLGSIPNKDSDLAGENYFASLQPGEDSRGIPLQLQKKVNFTLGRTLVDHVDPDPSAAVNEVRYVIERVCSIGTSGQPAILKNCDKIPPDQAPGTTINDPSSPVIPPSPLYRVTIRVDGPQNTASFVQAMLK